MGRYELYTQAVLESPQEDTSWASNILAATYAAAQTRRTRGFLNTDPPEKPPATPPITPRPAQVPETPRIEPVTPGEIQEISREVREKPLNPTTNPGVPSSTPLPQPPSPKP